MSEIREAIFDLSGAVPSGRSAFLGSIAYKKGVGLKPYPLKKMKEDLMIDATRELLGNEQLYLKSKHLMKEMENEQGLSNAVSFNRKDILKV